MRIVPKPSLFLIPNPFSDPHCIYLPHLLVSSNLQQSLRLPSSLMNLILTKRTSQLFCTMSLIFGLSSNLCFFMNKHKSLFFICLFCFVCKNTTAMVFLSFIMCHITRYMMSVCLATDDANIDHLLKVMSARCFFTVKLLFFLL